MNADNIYLILPGCDDTNRGDQALIWETVRLATEAGFIGNYYMLADPAHSIQSANKGIKQIEHILKHPSDYFSDTKNIKYTLLLKLKWTYRAIVNYVLLEPLIHRTYRKIFLRFYNSGIQNTVKMFSMASTVFVKGGGFLHAYGGVSDTYKIYYFLYHIRLALSFDLDVHIMPNSFGPFNAPLTAMMVKRVLRKCKTVMVRESLSQAALTEYCGINGNRFADIAFHLNIDPFFDSKKVLLEKGILIRNRPCVAITMRPYRFDGESQAASKYEMYKNSLCCFIEWLSKNDYFPVLIEHVASENDHENDIVCINEVVHMLAPETKYVVFSDRSLNAQQMKGIYSHFDYIIGTRFHSVIFALATQVPAIAITYGGNKGIGIMKDLGLDDYCIDISKITSESLITTFKKLVDASDDVKRTLKVKLSEISKQAHDIIRMLKEK